jgi:hypothetical protein
MAPGGELALKAACNWVARAFGPEATVFTPQALRLVTRPAGPTYVEIRRMHALVIEFLVLATCCILCVGLRPWRLTRPRGMATDPWRKDWRQFIASRSNSIARSAASACARSGSRRASARSATKASAGWLLHRSTAAIA